MASGKIKPSNYILKGEFAEANFAIDFARFAPPPDPKNPKQFKYYVRAIAVVPSTDEPGRYYGYPSKAREVLYGQLEPPPTQVTYYPPVEVTVLHPNVNILSYEPIHFEDPDWMYRFVVYKQPPHGPGPIIYWDEIYHVGDKLFLKPQSGDKGFWDRVKDFVNAVAEFIKGAVNWVSNAWASIKGALINFVAGVIPGCGRPGKTAAPQANAPGTKQAAQGLVDPCKLLTKAEAEPALGEQVKDPVLKDTKNPLGQKMCLYLPMAEKSDKFIQIAVVQNEGMRKELRDQGYNVEQLYKETKNNLPDAMPVPGIGDEAFWGTNGLHTLRGNVYLNISVGNTSKPENLELAKRVAEKVIGRL